VPVPLPHQGGTKPVLDAQARSDERGAGSADPNAPHQIPPENAADIEREYSSDIAHESYAGGQPETPFRTRDELLEHAHQAIQRGQKRQELEQVDTMERTNQFKVHQRRPNDELMDFLHEHTLFEFEAFPFESTYTSREKRQEILELAKEKGLLVPRQQQADPMKPKDVHLPEDYSEVKIRSNGKTSLRIFVSKSNSEILLHRHNPTLVP
jgi:hypothetical protein